MITLLFIGSLIAIVNALSSKSGVNKGGLIIGVNKHSHDALIVICLLYTSDAADE